MGIKKKEKTIYTIGNIATQKYYLRKAKKENNILCIATRNHVKSNPPYYNFIIHVVTKKAIEKIRMANEYRKLNTEKNPLPNIEDYNKLTGP